MDKITLGDISAAILFLGALIGGIIYLFNLASKVLSNWIKSFLKPIYDKLDSIDNKVDNVDMINTKNFLVRCISDIENGEKLNETEIERFYESYEHYIKIGGNSYIREKVEKLQNDKKI